MSAAWIDTAISPWKRRKVLASAGANSRSDIRFMHLPEASVRYRIAGEGKKTLVFATDPPVMLEQYDALIADLSRNFQVVIFEVPSFGYSLPNISLSLRFETATAVIGEFVRQLKLGPAVLAFPCVIGFSAIAIAGRHPELVSDLVIIQTPHWHEEMKWKYGRDTKNVLGTPYVGQTMLRLFRNKIADGWYRAALGSRERLNEFLQPTLEAFRHGAVFSLATAFQQYLAGDGPALKPVTQPTLIVWGDMDRTHKHTDKSSTMQYAPHARIEHFDNAGHFPELEQVSRFSALLRDFLAQR